MTSYPYPYPPFTPYPHDIAVSMRSRADSQAKKVFVRDAEIPLPQAHSWERSGPARALQVAGSGVFFGPGDKETSAYIPRTGRLLPPITQLSRLHSQT